MATTFKRAKRENVPLLIGLAGASGSGKTLCALLIASGIADAIQRKLDRPGRIFFADSERGRGLHYADRFDYEHGEIRPPFRPQSYGDAIAAAEEAGADVLIIDSFSHEWEGEGGVKDWADQILAANERMKPPAQWKDPKAAHQRLVNQMLAARPHIIVCMRAQEKLLMKEVPQFEHDGVTPKMWKGKQSTKTVIVAAKDRPLKERWVPICEKAFPYEITTSLLLTPDAPGVPIPLKLQDQHMPAFPEGQRISRESGAFLAEWAMGGAPTGVGAPGIDEARDAIRSAPTLERLEAIWRAKAMAPFRDDLGADLEARKAELTPQREPEGASGYDGI